MRDKLNILILEDRIQDADLLLHELRRSGFDFEWIRVETEEDFLSQIETHPDIILADFSMPQFDATRALEILRENNVDIPFIIISGTIGEDAAVSAMKAGANDFFAKNKLTRLAPAIERELREAREREKRRTIANQLRRSEDRFIKAFQSSPLALAISTLEGGRIIDVNESYLRMFGYDRDVIGHSSEEINVWVDWGERDRVVSFLREHGSLRDQEIQFRSRDGRILDTLTSLEILDLDEGLCSLSLIHDITERKRAEEATRRYNLRLQTLHAIDSAILNAQSDDVVAHIALRYFTNQMSIAGLSIVSMDFEAGEGIIFAMHDGGDETSIEARIALSEWLEHDIDRLRTGDIQILDVTASVDYVPPGVRTVQRDTLRVWLRIPLIAQSELIGVMSLGSESIATFTDEFIQIAREIADQMAIAMQQARLNERIRRHAAELEQRVVERTTELEWAKRRAESILNNSSDAIIMVDMDGKIEQTNPGFNALFGYKNGDTYGLSLLALVAAEYVDAIKQTLYEVATTDQQKRLEISFQNTSGAVVSADMMVAPLLERFSEANRLLICSVRDITERKLIEEGLRRAFERERELNEMKSSFVSIVSHEFRTPLTTILSSSQLIRLYRDRMSLERQVDHLDKIETQVRRLTDLLNDVLTLSKADAVGMEFNPVPLNLTAFCRAIAEEIQVITKTPHRIVVSVTGTCDGFMGDEKLLRHIVINLLTNAIKYSPEGGSVQFDLICTDNQAAIRISDQGLGIPEEDQKHLFEPFHRAKNVREISGTGLGLPIVKRAVDAHGGTISVNSHEGEGTTFTVNLPLASA
ncbi:MAG TPA: PAS domain S-box protein [Phototrophicaceae bacterium]|nr:PAS domain S-box protein [Phototrophicaceae bacterium]